MKRACIAIALLLLSFVTMATANEPLCVISPAAMPEAWRASADMQKSLNPEAWSAKEAEDVQYAIKIGIDEMLELYAERPGAVMHLGDDAVESLLDVTYSGGTGTPAVDAAARKGALRNLEMLVTPYLDGDPERADCEDFDDLLPLAIYAHRLFPPEDKRTAKVVAFANASYGECRSFADAIGGRYRDLLAGKMLPAGDVFDQVVWSIQLIEAVLVPGLDLPQEARDFPQRLWRYLETYPLASASTYKDGAWDKEFNETGSLATHIAFVPTGYHRYPLYIADSPKVYRFFRENFYPLLEVGGVDLVAQFVDALRQYGCDEKNDLQVRDGTRFLLKVFHDGDDRWMSYREPGEIGKKLGDYDLIHKPWSATIGIRPRVPQTVVPGSYGAVVRSWLPASP